MNWLAPYLNTADLAAVAPLLIVGALILVMMVVDLFLAPARKFILAYVGIAGLLLMIVVSAQQWLNNPNQALFRGTIQADLMSLFFNFIFFLVGVLTLLLSLNYVEQEGINFGEYYILVVASLFGMMLMAYAGDLIMVFLGLETMSIGLYVLAGFMRDRLESNEAALKYFLLGAFATGFLLFGIALIYGATGTTTLRHIGTFLQSAGGGEARLLFFLGMGLILIGFAFKVAAVPFHMWVPDVYQGAPTSITAFMAAGAKAAGFAIFLRVFFMAFYPLRADWSAVLWVLAVLTMTVGNVIALAQSNIKRMLAYSSIAHAGYILIAFVAGTAFSASSILFYLVAYTFMTLGAFGVLILMSKRGEENLELNDYAGLGFRHPLTAVVMAIFMLSLAGIPPTAGFTGKFFIFREAIRTGYIGLAIIGVLNSVVSVYYYLRVVVIMYMREPQRDIGPLSLSPTAVAALLIAVLGTLQMGLYPSIIMDMAVNSSRFLSRIMMGF